MLNDNVGGEGLGDLFEDEHQSVWDGKRICVSSTYYYYLCSIAGELESNSFTDSARGPGDESYLAFKRFGGGRHAGYLEFLGDGRK